jgi:hypothetical protein
VYRIVSGRLVGKFGEGCVSDADAAGLVEEPQGIRIMAVNGLRLRQSSKRPSIRRSEDVLGGIRHAAKPSCSRPFGVAPNGRIRVEDRFEGTSPGRSKRTKPLALGGVQ